MISYMSTMIDLEYPIVLQRHVLGDDNPGKESGSNLGGGEGEGRGAVDILQ